MGFPHRFLTASSVGIGYLLFSQGGFIWSIRGFIASVAALWAIQFTAWTLWTVLLYPKLFSPLRHLPEPNGGSWLNGQFWVAQAVATGVPMLEW